MNAIRTLRVAGVQVESRNLDVQGNLRRAEGLVAVAAERGAELVLCPEFLAAGYVYDPSIWDVAELRGGPTELWLARMARQHRLYIGASYLEATGNDFFNTFTPAAREILEVLLEKYADYGLKQLTNWGDVLKIPPLSDRYSVMEIARIFGGPEKMREAVEKMQALLYE